MTVQSLLEEFEALSEAEQHEVAVEILRRAAMRSATSELPDVALVTAAEELFRELDEQEAADGRP